MRDVLAGDVPVVLRADLYALAALAASGFVAGGYMLDLPPLHSMPVSFTACLFLRVMAIYRGWHVPAARWTLD